MSKQDKNMEGSLFSAEEMTRVMGGFDFPEDKPVTVLGITFDNDAKRREYFREELRKKLPELRSIEGFPIGSDDDIINLSDPPYYTACPNPWLNDFITQWEEEKKELVKEGKRQEEFEVKEPYASDVSEGKNNPIYKAHAYHTKVPHPAIIRYILHYTQPGDIVFDGFCGTGMTGVAANLCGSRKDVEALGLDGAKVGVRHSVCSDLSPIASLIASSYNLNFDAQKLEKEAKEILAKVEEEYGWMYETKNNGGRGTINYSIWSDVFTCPSCGGEIVLWNETVSEDTKSSTSEFHCPHCGTDCTKGNINKFKETCYDGITGDISNVQKCVPVRINGLTLSGKRFEKNIDSDDLAIYDKVMAMDISGLYTAPILIGDESKRILSVGLSHTHHFYTKRNYIMLSRIYELVKHSPILTAWFTSCLFNVSKMYKFRTDRKGSILYGTYYIPSLNIEYNPLRSLKGKLKDFISTDYATRGNSAISINSATNLSLITSNSIDYIFVDPPFGANLMYSELNSLWEGWIRISTNNTKEAIVNDSQNKDIFEYQKLMSHSLNEFYRILKPGKWLTMEFSNTSAAVWNSIQNALQGVGFVVVNVAALDKKQGSFKAVTTTTAVKQDLVITCYKPSDEFSQKMMTLSNANENVWDFVEDYLAHLPIHIIYKNATTAVVERSPKILYDKVITYYVQKGFPVPLDANNFQAGLRERYIERDGMFFTATQAAEYDEKKKLAPEFVPMGIIVSDEANGIQWLKNQLRDGAKTYQEIQPEWMQAINGIRKHDIIPELKQLLEENFIEEEGGKWRLPNIQDDKDVNALRTKSLLHEFKIYVQSACEKKRNIREARVEALRAGFKQCYIDKDFQTIVTVGDKIPQNLLIEDEVLLQFYDIAQNKL